MIVDDDQNYLSFASVALEQLWPDAKLVSFAGSLAALEFVALNSTDLVVTDFRMPDFDGLQLTAAIQAIDPAVRVVVMSGQPEAQELALARGAHAFAAKDALVEQLRLALQQLGFVR